jgi:manganese transport protein
MNKPTVLQSLKESLQSSVKRHKPSATAFSLFKYIGPGFLVTIGFIDPGNWATNIAAGSSFGYELLWVVSIGTIFIIILQHNAAHLGIVTGYCLSEAATIYLRPWLSRAVLTTAMLAGVSTELAEILGAAIALNMLFRIPLILGAVLVAGLVIFMLFTNSYRRLERWIIGLLSLIGLSFIIELGFVSVDWHQAAIGLISPHVPNGSVLVLMGVLGAIVMPSNFFLHSEIIQSRQWNMENDQIRERQLRFEYADTIVSMLVGWVINCAMIIVAAATFFTARTPISELSQAQQLLIPLAGSAAAVVFAIALFISGISAAVTCGMAGGSTYTGIFGEPYDITDPHTKWGILLTIIPAALIIFFLRDTFQSLVLSQVIVSIQLPFSIFLLIYLTSSQKVMGRFKNTLLTKVLLWAIAVIVVVLNIILLINAFH